MVNLGQTMLIPETKTPKQVFRDLRNYLAGRFVGATRDETLLDEVLKCLFCKLYIEVSAVAPMADAADRFEEARYIRSVFAEVKNDFPDVYSPDAEILLDPESLVTVMRECHFSVLEASSDPVGDAFEVFVGAESKGRSGQFFTPRCAADFLVKAIDPEPGELIIDPACGSGGFLASVARHLLAKGVGYDSLSSVASDTFYGVDKDEYLMGLAKVHVSLLTRGHPQVFCGDSLSLSNGTLDLRENLPQEGFDVVLTNPPFGKRIVAASPETLAGFELAYKWMRTEDTGQWCRTHDLKSQVSPQVLFLERSLSLLKGGGRLGIVLPESLVSNKTSRYVIEYLRQKAAIRAVVGMPESLFKTSGKGGTHTKTCLLIAVKRPARRRRTKIFMAEAKWCGHDSRARQIPHNDLPRIADNLERFVRKKSLKDTRLGFLIPESRLSSNVLCPRYYDPEVDRGLERLADTHYLVVLGDLVSQRVLQLSTGDEVGKLAYGTGDVPFIRTSDISNWELKADPKHGVSRDVFASLSAKQDVRPYDILMVKDGTYLIGTCAIISEYDTEIIYQSHLYKIRVAQENKYGLNSFLLLAILSCPVVQQQVRAKQFTQDIIDSLGDRINELVLPVPKSAEKRAEITAMVRRVVQDRVEARELARKARKGVLEP